MKHEYLVRSPSTLRSAPTKDRTPEARREEPLSASSTAAIKPGSNSQLARPFPLLLVARLLLALAVCAGLTGCFGFLKPAKPTARHFVLTSLPAAEPAAAQGGSQVLGIGQVKLAAYLFNTSLAVRQGTNEIDYLPTVFWAERLDTGLQRVLAANLATLLPTDQLRLSAWQTSDVSVEVYVAIERFDVDTRGQAVLVAWWRILSPGGEKTLKAGECRRTRQGPPPDVDPSGAVATLSELVADLSRQVAQAVKDTAPASHAASDRPM